MSVETDEAPKLQDIIATDATGKPFKLKDVKQRYALLSFLRYAGCPFCNLSIHRLAMEHDLLRQSNCEVVSFVQSNTENIQKNIYERHEKKPRFPIIPDKDMKFYKLFDIKPSYKATKRMIVDIPHWVHAVRDHGFKQKSIDGSLFIAPALFLVHIPTMKIIHADYASDLFEHDTFTPIYDKILTHSES
jgi:peroxiredoxin